MRRALGFLFTLEGRVSRGQYAAAGFGLMALKYAVEAQLIRAMTGARWTPLDYLLPLWSVKESKLGHAPDWFLLALGAWTLPFVWIGASMTLRRALDARLGGTPVTLFFAPFLNYAVMLLLVFAPSRPRAPDQPPDARERESSGLMRAALVAVGLTTVGGLALAVLCTTAARSYGAGLFLGLPFVMGFEAGYVLNRKGDRGGLQTLAVAMLAMVLMGLTLLLVAVEGIACILMAAPLAGPLVLFGAVFGRALARGRASRTSALVPAILVAPFAWLEGRVAPPAEFEVESALEIDAPRERVWSNVIGFSALPEPARGVFSAGFAYPVRATIEGEGVGAIRRCEFSTGPFVEPITRWEPPARLSFDVRSQPLPMEEWTLYSRIQPPHLERSFRALRGEFRLVELPGGRTRLEGSTWYQLQVFPLGYWRLLADQVVHRIHLRVLEHIARLSESG